MANLLGAETPLSLVNQATICEFFHLLLDSVVNQANLDVRGTYIRFENDAVRLRDFTVLVRFLSFPLRCRNFGKCSERRGSIC